MKLQDSQSFLPVPFGLLCVDVRFVDGQWKVSAQTRMFNSRALNVAAWL